MYDYYDELDSIDDELVSINTRLDHLSQAMVSGDNLISESIQVQQGIYNCNHQLVVFSGSLLLVLFIICLTRFLPTRKGVFKK